MFTSFGTELWDIHKAHSFTELWDIHKAHRLSNIFAVYRFLIGPATSFASSFASSFGIELRALGHPQSSRCWHGVGTSTKLTVNLGVNLGTLTKPTTIRLFLLIIESR